MRLTRVPRPLLLIAIVAVSAILTAAGPSSSRRARPPKWDKTVSELFFEDARQKLAGERPNLGAQPAGAITADPAAEAPASSAGDSGGFAWSQIIAPETIEDEVKTLQLQVSENVQTPAKFKGGGYKDGRRQFTELAMLFAIIAEYDGDVRWKQQAAGIRDVMGRAGFNCKVGTDASFNEAKLRKDDLESLVRGGTVDVPAPEGPVKWDKVVSRPPLMQRIDVAHHQALQPWTANAGEFNKNIDKVLHEAQLLAAMSEVMQREGLEDADDETYLEYAQEMRDQALQIAEAAKQKNYEQARAASAGVAKACTTCHDAYRSN